MTRHSHHPGHVVVGADGSEPGYAGVRYAALEASRLGVPLDVVHVMPAYLPVGPLLVIPDGSLQAYGNAVIGKSEQAVRDVCPDLAFETHLLSGGRVEALVEFSAESRCLVLGARHLRAKERVWTGATVTAVSARAACPVVVVPPTWEPGETPRRIVAAFKSPKHSAELFNAGFALADELGKELVLLHVWRLEGVYDSMVASPEEIERWNLEERAVIEELVTGYRDAFPKVTCHVEVVHGRPARALLDASRHAERLLLVKPAHGAVVHHLGGTARAVLRDAYCPVEVLPPLPLPPDPSRLVVEEEGHLVR